MFTKILVPLDGSEFAEQALPLACSLAQRFDGEIILVRVVVPENLVIASPAMGALYPELPVEQSRLDREEALAYLRRVSEKCAVARVSHTGEVFEGAPAEMILEAAERTGADLIVMSTHGRTGLSRLVYGSVAEAVLRGGRVPVLLVPYRTQPIPTAMR
jgi:nucleotide-binding universal stress UspA family protein